MKQQASSAALRKIDHVTIVVKDLYAAKKFFLDLGLRVIHEGSLTGVWIDKITNLENVKAQYCALGIKEGQTNLELIAYDSPADHSVAKEEMPNKPGIRHIAFEVASIEKVVAQLKKKHIKLFSEIQFYEPSNKKLCYFYGPEGIILELAEYGKK